MSWYNKYRPQEISEIDSTSVREYLSHMFGEKEEEVLFTMVIVRNGQTLTLADLTQKELLEEKQNALDELPKFLASEGISVTPERLIQKQEEIAALFDAYIVKTAR